PDIAPLRPETCRDIVWFSPVGIFTSTPEGQLTFANPAMARIYGYSSPAELIAAITDISRQIYAVPAERESFQRQLREMGQLINHEYRHRRRDGSVFWVSLNAQAIYDQHGELLYYQGFSTDITARKKAASQVESRERYLQKILDTSGEGFWVINAKGFLQEVNQTYCAMSGYCREELLELTISDLDALENPEETATRIHRIKTHGSEMFETLHRRKDGTIYPVEISVTWLDQDGGQMVCFCRDISERKRAAEALKTEHRRLENIIEATRIGTWEWNVQTGETIFNQRWAAIIGYTLDELVPVTISTWKKFAHPDDLAHSAKLLAEHFAGERAYYDFESRMRHKEGHWVWVRDRGRLISRTEDGQPLLMFGTHTDITQRKEAEKALWESEALFRGTFEQSNIGKALTAPDGTLLKVNQAFAEMLGYTPAELDKFDFATLTLPADLGKSREAAQALVSGQQNNYRFEKRYIHRNQEIIWADVSVTLLRDEQGAALYFVTDIVDITARKRAEEEKEKLQAQLSQAQKMESVGRLAGGVAHDFNNMLGVILGHTEMALEEADPVTPVHASLLVIEQAAKRSAALTRQLLTFARKQTVAPQIIEINHTVEGMLKMLHRLVGEDINLQWQPGENLPPVKVDPAQIDQLLANLCVNSRDAISGVGKITIETSVASFDETSCATHLNCLPGEYVLLAVSDDGKGMDQATLSHIFEPFFTTKEQGKGTGLGLASVFGMVKQNRGFINVYSEPDQGTTFKIYLPRHDKSASGPERPTILQTERGQETVLLVEDELAILEMTTLMLTRLGYTVLAANSPGEAIRLADEYQGQIDLLVTDVVMPEMNGRELGENLLSRFPKLKRLFMSGYTANVIKEHGVLNQGAQFMQKPFSMNQLSHKVRQVLDAA
ncbi:MAG: PAS domain S-box protein, partial [Desulforhopalus sp.]|nr:PAS domain S-box protein [Desulforhopalus sp.]